MQTDLFFFCFADAEVTFLSELKSGNWFAANATACSKRKLYKNGCYMYKKHVCVIDISRERKCMRSDVARAKKGRGKVQTNPQKTNDREVICPSTSTEERENCFLYKAWPKVANLHTARLELGIEISLPVICHLEKIYNERNISQFICFSHPNRC